MSGDLEQQLADVRAVHRSRRRPWLARLAGEAAAMWLALTAEWKRSGRA